MRRRLLWLAVVLSLYVGIAKDSRHHWHEGRYVYSAANFGIGTLVDGGFDPGPPGARSNREVGAWYWGQIFHEILLSIHAKLFGRGLMSLSILEWTYGLFVPIATLVMFVTLRGLPLNGDAGQVALISLLSPLGAYLGFKLMAESPALLFGTASLYFSSRLLEPQTTVTRAIYVMGACIGLALCALSMVYMPLMILGFWAALLAVFGRELGYRRLLATSLLVSAGGLLVIAAVLRGYTLKLMDYLELYAYFSQYVKPASVSVFGVMLAGSLLYLLVPLSLLSERKRDLAFYAVWLAGSWLPVLIFSRNYIEPRFLSVGLVPFAGMLALSFEVLVRRATKRGSPDTIRTFVRALSAVVVASVAYISQPLMPFEMNSRDLFEAAKGIWRVDPKAQVVVPWNYTDYHLLKLAFPERPVYLVQAPVDNEGRVLFDEVWMKRQRANYGEGYISNSRELSRLDGSPIYYLGHGILPPFASLRSTAEFLRMGFVSRQIDAIRPMNHLAQSWMWHNPEYVFDPAGGVGEYQVFRVGLSTTPVRGGHAE